MPIKCDYLMETKPFKQKNDHISAIEFIFNPKLKTTSALRHTAQQTACKWEKKKDVYAIGNEIKFTNVSIKMGIIKWNNIKAKKFRINGNYHILSVQVVFTHNPDAAYHSFNSMNWFFNGWIGFFSLYFSFSFALCTAIHILLTYGEIHLSWYASIYLWNTDN